MTKTDAKLFVVSGPSGVGKGTLCDLLRQRYKNIAVSVSATTRKPRSIDAEGVTYYFKTEEEFRQMITDNQFLEWAVYNGNHYGTPLAPVLEKLESGTDVLLEIDVQGALNVMEKYPEGIFIFIAPPSAETLRQRLSGRGTESEEEISRRISAAEAELLQQDKYDYVVINDDLENAACELLHIIEGHKKP